MRAAIAAIALVNLSKPGVGVVIETENERANARVGGGLREGQQGLSQPEKMNLSSSPAFFFISLHNFLS